MSLAIDVEKITRVLLADGWHEVYEKSFTIDSYEFLEYPEGFDHSKGWHQKDKFGETLEPFYLHGGGHNGICASGFSFHSVGRGDLVSGPLTSILAVRHKSSSNNTSTAAPIVGRDILSLGMGRRCMSWRRLWCFWNI